MQAPHTPDFMVFTGNANPAMAADIASHLNISLGAATVGRFSDGEVTVEINQWQNAFFNSLEKKDQAEFMRLIGVFTGLAAAYIVMAVYQLYLSQMLQIKWRRWLTA